MLPLLFRIITAKIALKLVSRFSVFTTILTLLVFGVYPLTAQTDSTQHVVADSGRIDSANFIPIDILKSDSLNLNDSAQYADTLQAAPKKNKQAVEEPVFYSANDSMSIIMANQTVLLWGKGKIEYQDIDLEAEFITSDLERQEIYAIGAIDTSGNYYGKPVFNKGNESFVSDSMRYNIKSSKGIIYNVISKQGEGVLHSDMTKRDEQGHVHLKGGKYTTCEAEHPHFYMELTKAIAIPNDKIISGPAYLVVEDVPIPLLGLPFGFFPSTSKRGAGVIIPKYGEEKNRGFYLRDGGWYQPIGEYVDFRILGDIYSKGSWAVDVGTDYRVRYKFNGTSKFNYNVYDDNTDDTFEPDQTFKWLWTHRQDPKANPTQSFSANVNFSSSGFDRRNEYSHSQAYNSQKSSSISFTKSFPGTPFNLSLSANARQNTIDSTLTMNLPKGSFNASTIYPFRSKTGAGKLKWYENIGFSYNSQFDNYIDIADSALFLSSTWNDLNYGFKHTIPLTISLKSEKFKMLTLTPSLSYTGVMNSWYIKNRTEYNAEDDEYNIVTDTIRDVTYAHAVNPSISVGLTPKVTGMFLNSRPDPNVLAFRHVMQPRATFSYVPDMSAINPDYYDVVYYSNKGQLDSLEYSYYDKNLYKAPTFSGRSGSVGLGLSNNLEMKLRPKNDTTGEAEPQKVSLLRSFNFSTSYNPFATQYKWSDLNFTTSTSLFKGKLSFNLTSSFTPYDFEVDSVSGNAKRIDEYNFDNGKGLYRFTRMSFSTSFRLKSQQGGKDDEIIDEGIDEEGTFSPYYDPLNPDAGFGGGSQSYGDYVDFNIPWTLSFSYSYSLNRPFQKIDQTITNIVNIRGDFSLTPKWKIGFNTGYDFENQKVTMSNIRINRDLHCWQMSFSMVPFGTRKSYSFYINAKSSILRDLKYDRRESWYDNF